MKCKKCENIHKDPDTGMMICLTCGTVHEESQIVVDALEFDDNQNAAGTFLDLNKQTNYYPGRRNILNQMNDSNKRNTKKAMETIEETARKLTIKEDVVRKAKKFYMVASNKKFTQGRETDLMVGAVLYLACRCDENNKYLLIDFSEVLKINLFSIGTLYIKLLKLLDCEIPSTFSIIDPSLYMHRFCIKFNLGKKAREVENTALKILEFMDRDWIITGRRPSGICGACILISAKLHKLSIDINLISKVVHVCPQTILNRIDEFSLTRVASMTKEEFESFQNSHFYPGSDPPAFLKALKEKNKEKKEIKNEEEEKISDENENKIHNEGKKNENGQTIIENGSNKNDLLAFRPANSEPSKNMNNNSSLFLRPRNSRLSKNNNNSLTFRQGNSGLSNNNNNISELLYFKPNDSGISNNNNDLNVNPSHSGLSKINEELNLRANNSRISKNNVDLNLRPHNSSKKSNQSKALSMAEEKLSIIPDNEDYKYIYSKDEYGLRKQFWEIMFKDWIEHQKEKEEREGKAKKRKDKEPRKRNKKNIFQSDGIQRTPFEAIKNSNKFGRKINYSYIKSIMSKRN